MHYPCHCFCLYSSDFVLMNSLSSFCRGLESCPCTLAPWGPASVIFDFWTMQSACLFTTTSAYTCQTHLPTCVDFHPPNTCFHVPRPRFQVPSGPHPVQTTFPLLILSFTMCFLFLSTFLPTMLALFEALGAVWLSAGQIKGPIGQ